LCVVSTKLVKPERTIIPFMTRIDPAFWRGRRVFLTGHTGFKGGWLALALHRMGARVFGYALAPPTTPSLFDVAGINALLESQIGDIRDRAALQTSLAASKAEIVFHLAAQPLVRAAFDDPASTFEANVMGTVNLLEAVRAVDSVQAVVAITTDKVYENQEWVWPYRETDALGGQEPYGASKACCEIIAHAYRGAYFRPMPTPIQIATVRAGNIVGGGDWADDRLVPDAMRAFSAGRPLSVRNPGALRPWQHVLEPVAGYLTLAERLFAREPNLDRSWNFGPSPADAKPVSYVAEHLVRHWGGTAQWRADGAVKGHEARLLTLDSSLANDLLSWIPVWSLDRCLEETTRWYKTFYAGDDVRPLMQAQLQLVTGIA
jgi:CDP-glucose 4,6-dehydratase